MWWWWNFSRGDGDVMWWNFSRGDGDVMVMEFFERWWICFRWWWNFWMDLKTIDIFPDAMESIYIRNLFSIFPVYLFFNEVKTRKLLWVFLDFQVHFTCRWVNSELFNMQNYQKSNSLEKVNVKFGRMFSISTSRLKRHFTHLLAVIVTLNFMPRRLKSLEHLNTLPKSPARRANLRINAQSKKYHNKTSVRS